MTYAGFGLILSKMAGVAAKRAQEHRHNLGPQNAALLWAVHHMLVAGSEEALKQAKDAD